MKNKEYQNLRILKFFFHKNFSNFDKIVKFFQQPMISLTPNKFYKLNDNLFVFAKIEKPLQ
jgi:hypothetical protein